MAVVVATRNRSSHLERLLDALAAQAGVGSFEVVVIDDGSSDDTASVLERRAIERPQIRHLREPVNVGPAAARNRGWRTTSAPIVAFTDDDCVPDAVWLARLTAAIDAGADIAQGRTEPIVEQRPGRGPFSMTVEKLEPDGFYETCNIAYRREVLESVDGFDDDFRFPYGEDTDLAWRAIKGGARTVFVDDALVQHEIWPFGWSGRLADIRRRDGLIVLLAKHPELRRLFPSPWYQKETHPRAVLATVALVALALRPGSPVRWMTAAAGVAFYQGASAPSRANVRRRDWPWVLPLCLASDLADVASLARSGLRRGVFFI